MTNKAAYQHYHPEVFDPIRHEWEECPYPDITTLQNQTLALLAEYSDDEIDALIDEIEAYLNEATAAMLEDNPDFSDVEDIRWMLIAARDDIAPKGSNKKHFHYMAALTLMFLSKAAYQYVINETTIFINMLLEAYRSFEYANKFHFVEVDLDEYRKKYPKDFNRIFSSAGGQKSTSIYTQDKPAVLTEWEKIKSQGLSRNKSANVIIANLSLKHAHSTILTWIREHERVPVRVQSNGST